MYLNVLTERLLLSMRFNTIKILSRLKSSTIYGLSTGSKDSGTAIAVIRISGQKTFDALQRLIKQKSIKCLSNPRTAILSGIYDHKTNELLDRGIVIWFPKPNSYTGEDMCELHVHGSNAVISAILSALSRLDGFRPSEAGEFTRRALINNKMDIIGAEAIHDLIRSNTSSQRRRALSAMSGNLANLYDQWRRDIIKFMANIEVNIDFGEEELIDHSVLDNLKSQLQQMVHQIETHLNRCKNKSDLIKDGLRVTIIGESNAGKSTLINQLCERDLSIVSPISGTTRDVIETWLNINGYSVCISDTAGIKDLTLDLCDSIEVQGIQRAIQRAKNSDLLLYVIDATTLLNSNLDINNITPNYIKEIIDSNIKLIYLINKIDLLSNENCICLQQNCNKLLSDWNLISCKTLMGFEQFTNKFTKVVQELCGNPMQEMLFSTNRHEAHLIKAIQQINLSIQTIDKDIAIAAHHLRQSALNISYITGKITTDHILDVIFKDFCIGK